MRKRSEELDWTLYDTDKLQNGYFRFYDRIFAHLLDEPVRLLELGVRSGGSLLLWRDYFPEGIVAGVDVEPPTLDLPEDRTRFFRGRQEDAGLLGRVAAEVAPSGFDIIVDDAAHVASLARASFRALFDNHLKPGGIYVIEDWGTGYWEAWPDGEKWREGEPHHAGMVGFVKELIDEQGAHDATRGWHDQPWERSSRFESMLVTPGMVFVTKREF